MINSASLTWSFPGWVLSERKRSSEAVVGAACKERNVSLGLIDAEQALARRFAMGDPDVIPRVVQQYSSRLFHIILRMTGSRSDAEDVLQNAWLRIIRNAERFDAQRPLAPWLIRIAVNTCRDHLRYERIRRLFRANPAQDSTENDSFDVSDPRPASFSDSLDAQTLLSVLSPKLRSVVVLKYYDGMTSEEIATVLGIPEGTVKSRLNLALEKMRAGLGKEIAK